MRDPVFGEHAEIFRTWKIPIPNLDSIRPILWQLAEKRVESLRKSRHRKVRLIKPPEFKHQQSDLASVRLARFQECLRKQLRIEKVLIDLARSQSELGQIWELLDCDRVSDLERELKVVRHLAHNRLEKIPIRKFVKCCIN